MKTTGMIKTERGQVLPIAVIGVLIVIIMAALIVDGGSLLANRRKAQAAADAGALAGAKMICAKASDQMVIETAQTYAMDFNNATNAEAVITNHTESSDIVTVTAWVTNNSFFARVLGEDFLQASAIAEAGCFPPDGNYLMPIAWSCRPPVGGATFDPELGCKMQALSWTDVLGPLVEGEVSSTEIEGNEGKTYEMDGDSVVDDTSDQRPPKQIYIVMDKIATNTETLCKEDLDPTDPLYLTAIICDLDGDGKNDIEGGGNRGWLDLNNGGGGASDLRSWIINGLDFPLARHTWLAGQTGSVTNVYEAIKENRQGEVVLIPVFNSICDDSDPLTNAACMEAAHADPWPEEPATGDIDNNAGQAPKFHIVDFAAFYISCVHTHQSDRCPGFSYAQDMNPDPSNPNKSLIPDNTPSVEGYFLEDYEIVVDTEDACLIDTGNCTTSLTR